MEVKKEECVLHEGQYHIVEGAEDEFAYVFCGKVIEIDDDFEPDNSGFSEADKICDECLRCVRIAEAE